jgi:hypothetical protein
MPAAASGVFIVQKAMSPNRIEELVAMIPRRAPYLSRVSLHTHRQYGTPVEVDIYATAKNDPTFGWMFVRSFIDTGEPMPSKVVESNLVRTYCYLRYRAPDHHVRRALELEHNSNWQRQVLLKCMLLMEDQTCDQIAKFLHLTPEAVTVYEVLFWNAKDLLKDKVYINTLVYPNSRQVELGHRYAREESPSNLALRASQQHGISAALEWLGIENPTQEFGGEVQAKSFEARILSTGNFLAKMGFLHQKDLAAIASARSVLNSIKMGGEKQKDDDSRRGLAGMSLSMSVNESFMRIMTPDLESRLAVQRGIETEEANKPTETALSMGTITDSGSCEVNDATKNDARAFIMGSPAIMRRKLSCSSCQKPKITQSR